jgi:hypothetical protein
LNTLLLLLRFKKIKWQPEMFNGMEKLFTHIIIDVQISSFTCHK